MDTKKRIDIILEEIDKAYMVPAYMESRVREGIGKALKRIHETEKMMLGGDNDEL